jgi:poly-gamma-glutamate capsule biosynthesis protein CapA/YwtB (metallophosphatase superfamily)
VSRTIPIAVASAVGLVFATTVGASAAAAAGKPFIRSNLPAWLAPGGRLVVVGRADPNELVSVHADSRRLAAARSGRAGRFRLVARAPRVGRYRLELRTRGTTTAMGILRVRPLVLAAVGDVTFGARVGDAIRAEGPRYPWLDVAPVLRQADIATANLEGAVSRRGSPVPGKEYTFRGPPRALRATAYFAGVDVVSLANNHTLDYGRVAFRDTIAYARLFGLATVGGGADLARARRPAIFTAGGIRVAMLGYSDVRPLGFDATPSRAGAAPAFPRFIAADVRGAARRADVTVVWFHWGEERRFRPNARQRELAGVSFRAGATVVLGAHPHVLQPIDRGGRRLVAWSLGNFVFGANSPGTERTGILRLRLGASGVLGWGFRRARIGGPYRIQPRLLR